MDFRLSSSNFKRQFLARASARQVCLRCEKAIPAEGRFCGGCFPDVLEEAVWSQHPGSRDGVDLCTRTTTMMWESMENPWDTAINHHKPSIWLHLGLVYSTYVHSNGALGDGLWMFMALGWTVHHVIVLCQLARLMWPLCVTSDPSVEPMTWSNPASNPISGWHWNMILQWEIASLSYVPFGFRVWPFEQAYIYQ